MWKGGKAINPLTVPQEPSEPIKNENKEAFEFVRDRIIAELEGRATEDMIVTELDSIVLPAKVEQELAQKADDEQK